MSIKNTNEDPYAWKANWEREQEDEEASHDDPYAWKADWETEDESEEDGAEWAW